MVCHGIPDWTEQYHAQHDVIVHGYQNADPALLEVPREGSQVVFMLLLQLMPSNIQEDDRKISLCLQIDD